MFRMLFLSYQLLLFQTSPRSKCSAWPAREFIATLCSSETSYYQQPLVDTKLQILPGRHAMLGARSIPRSWSGGGDGRSGGGGGRFGVNFSFLPSHATWILKLYSTMQFLRRPAGVVRGLAEMMAVLIQNSSPIGLLRTTWPGTSVGGEREILQGVERIAGAGLIGFESF